MQNQGKEMRARRHFDDRNAGRRLTARRVPGIEVDDWHVESGLRQLIEGLAQLGGLLLVLLGARRLVFRNPRRASASASAVWSRVTRCPFRLAISLAFSRRSEAIQKPSMMLTISSAATMVPPGNISAGRAR